MDRGAYAVIIDDEMVASKVEQTDRVDLKMELTVDVTKHPNSRLFFASVLLFRR